jgi:selenide,water dikinase
MERSQRLGHCVCDPRRPCPCDVFREQGLCPCAGERPEPADLSQLQLTRLVRNAGCASKIAPADLEAVLARLPEVKDPAVISGLAAADDAAIYRLSDNLCLVQTVDVFTPCVDDPALFGRICAANCLSDIYAMGGEPRTALSILAFPSETLDGEIMYRMLAGAMETLAQASVALIGGHSIKDEEIKLGFAVTGTIEPGVAAALERAKAGDLLVLTKPLGTGVLAFSRQLGRAPLAGSATAESSMATLNLAAAQAMKGAGATACTDITGFGLLGHLLRLARQSRLSAEVFAPALPAFAGALEALREGVIAGAVERNREYVGEAIEVAPGVEEAAVHLGCDAQTSGGLLIAIPPERFKDLQDALGQRGVPGFLVGRLVSGPPGRIHLLNEVSDGASSTRAAPPGAPGPRPQSNTLNTTQPPQIMKSSPDMKPHSETCCAAIVEGVGGASTVPEAQQAFGALLQAAQAPGALDAKTKELIFFGLVVYSRCTPCFAAHWKKAAELGLTPAALDEAAWCAIAMGGAPVRMFYREMRPA